MSIDSTAELLFNISANADDASENITRFRALMGSNIEDMSAQFEDWAHETLGEIDSVKAAMTAGIAAIAAGVLAAGVAIKEVTDEYTEYGNQVYKAMLQTGLSAETLSAMHSAAAKTNVSFDLLTDGIVKFEKNVVLASQGSKQQLEAFQGLGISQKDVIAGQKDLLPLLEKVMDGFHNNTSAVQKAAIARDLFSRSGPELIEFLSKGSAYLKENAEEAEKLGLILHAKDAMAAREFTLAQAELKEESEGLAVTIGKHVVPMLEKAEAAMIAGVAAAKSFGQGGLHAFQAPLVFLKEYAEEITKISKAVEGAKAAGGDTPPMIDPPVTKIKEAKQEFTGLTSIMETLQGKLAAEGSGWDRLTNDVRHYTVEIAKATAELNKMHAEGKITPQSYDQQTAALAAIPTMLGRVIQATTAKLSSADTQAWNELVAKSGEAHQKLTQQLIASAQSRLDVDREIAEKEAAQDDNSYAAQRARLTKEMDDWAAALAKKTELTEADWAQIARITAAGMAKISKSEAEAFQSELQRLQEHLDQTSTATATYEQKLWLDYQKELQQYSTIEEQKVLKTAQSEAQIVQIQQIYAQIRQQLLQKYQNDLMQFQHSQGFQGVFGAYFQNLINQDSNLMHQWATSTNQSILLVRVTLQSLQEQAKKTFDQFVQGMGQTMVQAIVTGKSVTKAMEQMLASTLESFAGQAMTAAIMATAWGFYNLAMGNYTAAGADFTSAAIFGSVGAAAAIAGKAMTPSSGSAGAGSGGSGGSGGSQSGGSSYGSSGGYGQQGGQSSQQPNVYVNVEGHVIGPSGAAELCDIINQAVYGNNSQLYASHNPQGVPL